MVRQGGARGEGMCHLKGMSASLCALVISALLLPTPAEAGLWSCRQPNGALEYQDYPSVGCQQLALPTVSKGQSPQAALPTAFTPQAAPDRSADRGGSYLTSRAFSASTRSVPVVLVQTLSSVQRAQGFYLPSSGDAALVDLSVYYLPSGEGPVITVDRHFRANAKEALTDAVYAAAKALGYDPRFLQVHLSMPTSMGVGLGNWIDGPSAGVAWTVAVASAILGDQIRPGVCMSGTIRPNLEVGPVMGLENKVDGCHYLRYHEFIVPVGQTTLDLSSKAMSYSMRVTEAVTLADAYEAATSQPLRTLR
jgi:hypothetical protein